MVALESNDPCVSAHFVPTKSGRVAPRNRRSSPARSVPQCTRWRPSKAGVHDPYQTGIAPAFYYQYEWVATSFSSNPAVIPSSNRHR